MAQPNFFQKLVAAQQDESSASKSNFMWVPHPEDGYQIGEVIGRDAEFVEVQTESGSRERVKMSDVHPINPAKFDKVDDMAKLSYLNEPSVLHNLKLRYFDNLIYTNSGLFLVAVNPYKQLPIYTPEVIESYKGRRRNEVPPHVFAVADNAYRDMLNNKKNQSMLITGESGAGKTENTKKVIQYLTAVAGHHHSTLEKQILQANPILEAFGNAKTVKNDNSSRFGKFIEIQFNAAGYIIGADIKTYLLEKSRVVFQSSNERNFHIFYQLLTGLSAEEKAAYKLTEGQNYRYVSRSGCFTIPGINDAKELKDLKDSMKIVGFSEEEQQSVFKTVAAVLHLGNMEFKEAANGCAGIPDRAALNNACELLGVDPSKMEKALTRPLIKAGNEIIETIQNASQAAYNRDALVYALYGRMFDFIVKKINQSLSARESISAFIGVLDIAGFEIFQDNFLEQLCINYTNEKLQQFFNSHMFRKEQEEYLREQIEWKFIDFGQDLQPTIDLIEKANQPVGIFGILEAQCLMPSTTDEDFTNNVLRAHKTNKAIKEVKADRTNFILSHYAGDVTYKTQSWIKKNVDPLLEDVKAVMLAGNRFISDIFSAESVTQSANPKAGRFSTVSNKYKNQLTSLMNVLNSTDPHFIRCIKPNEVKRPGVIHANQIIDQLKCNGVLEGIRIARKGYPNRVPFDEFIQRYSILCPKDVLATKPTKKGKCDAIITHIGFEETRQYKIGLTKVFFKAGQHAQLEEIREAKIAEYIVAVQAGMRGYLARKNYLRLMKRLDSIRLVQRNWRSFTRLRDWQWWKLFQKARPVIKVQGVKDTIDKLEKQVAELKSKLEEEAQVKKGMEMSKQQLLGDIEKLRVSLQDQDDQKSRLETNIADLNNKVQQLSDQMKRDERERGDIIGEKRNVERSLDSKNAELEAASETISTLEGKRSELVRDLEKMQQAIKASEQRNADLANGKGGLEKDLNDLRAKLMEEERARAEVTKTKNQLENQLREFNDRLEAESFARKELEKNKQKVEGALKDTKKQLDTESANARTLDANLKGLETQLTKVQTDLKEEQRQRGNLESLKKKLEGGSKELVDQIDSLSRDRDNAERASKSLKSEIDDLKFQIAKLKDDNEALHDQNSTLASTLNDVQNKLRERELSLAEMEAVKASLEREIRVTKESLTEELEKVKNQFTQTKRKLETDAKTLQDQLTEAVASKSNMDRDKKKVEADLAKLRKSLEDESRDKSRLDAGARALESDVAALRSQIADLEGKVAELERIKRALESQIQELNAKVVEEEDQKAAIESKRRALQRELTDTKEELEHAVTAKEDLEGTVSDLQAQIANLKKALDREKDEKTRAEREISDAKREMDNLRASLEDAQSKNVADVLEKERRKAAQQLDELSKALEAEKANRDKAEKKSKRQGDDNKKLTQTVSDMEKRVQEAEENKKRVEDALSALRSQFDQSSRGRGDLEKEKKSVEARVQEAENKVHELEGELARLINTLKGKDREIDEIREQLEEAEDEKEELERHIKVAEDKASQLTKELEVSLENTRRAEAELGKAKSDIDRLKDDASQEGYRAKTAIEKFKKDFERREQELLLAVEKEAAEKKELQVELKDLSKELKELAKRAEANEGSQAALRTIKELNNEIEALKGKLDTETTSRREIESAKRALELQAQQFKDSLDEEERKRKTAEAARNRLVGEVDELRELADEIEDVREELSRVRADGEQRLTQTTKDLEKERHDRAVADNKVTTLARDLEEAKKALALEREQTAAAVGGARKKFEEELRDLEAQVNEAKREKANVGKTTKTLERQLRDLERKLDTESKERALAADKASSVERQLKQVAAQLDTAARAQSVAESAKAKLEQDLRTAQDEKRQLEDNVARMRDTLESESSKRKRLEKKFSRLMKDDDE